MLPPEMSRKKKKGPGRIFFLSDFESIVYCAISYQGCRIKTQKNWTQRILKEKKENKRKKCRGEVKSTVNDQNAKVRKSQMKVAVKGRRERSLKRTEKLGMSKRSFKRRLARLNRRVPDWGWINVLQGYSAV